MSREAEVELPVVKPLWLNDAGEAVSTVAWSPDGDLIAMGLGDGRVRVLRASDGEIISEFQAHKGDVLALGFSNGSGERLATGGQDGRGAVWDLTKKIEITATNFARTWVEQLFCGQKIHPR